MRLPAARLGPLLGLLAAISLATVTNAAAPTSLKNGIVTPTSGTTATVFQFSVQFQSGTTTASSVTASVAGRTVPLSGGGVSAGHETWTGSSTLPAGSWTITYSAVSASGANPSPITAGPVVVTSPTPPPTARPTPRPTPRPTVPPATATPLPASSVTPGTTPPGSTVSEPSDAPSASQSAPSSRGPISSTSSSRSPGAGPAESPPFHVPPEGVVAIGLLGAVAVAAALGERRRRRAVAAFREAEISGDGSPVYEPGPDEAWAGDFDDETVANIEYEDPQQPIDTDLHDI
jgi:hypothetical protein